MKILVEKAYHRAIAILEENRDKLEELANILLEKEVIFSEDLEKIFGKRLNDNLQLDDEMVEQPKAEKADDTQKEDQDVTAKDEETEDAKPDPSVDDDEEQPEKAS